MAHTDVSSCVLSIVGSFASGLDVFKKLREKKKRRRRSRRDGRECDARVEEEEMRLSRSLRQGPEDIGREYARNLYAVGNGFGVGDAPAQASLAEILLKLNTGLVGIISSFLGGDKQRDAQPDYQTLTQLSDRSRIDTCRALRSLFKRMTKSRLAPAIAIPAGHAHEWERSGNSPKRKRKASPSHTRVKGPMLARVVIKDSSRPSQIAMVKPSERRKKSSSTSSSELSKAPSTPSTPPPANAPTPPPRPLAARANTAPAIPEIAKKHQQRTTAEQPGQRQTAARSTPRLPDRATLEQHPPQSYINPATQSTSALAHRTRKPTPTYYSIASDSTRLGEIPLHKWNVPPDFDQMSLLNHEAGRRGWPMDDLGASAEDVDGRPRGWGLRRLLGRK